MILNKEMYKEISVKSIQMVTVIRGSTLLLLSMREKYPLKMQSNFFTRMKGYSDKPNIQ